MTKAGNTKTAAPALPVDAKDNDRSGSSALVTDTGLGAMPSEKTELAKPDPCSGTAY